MTDSHSYPEGADVSKWNADDWHLFLSRYLDSRANYPNGMATVALMIADSMEAMRPVAQTGKLPRTLTAENGAKAALMGEFHEEFYFRDEEGDEQTGKVPVSWDTIKRIWVAAVAHFDRTSSLSSTDRVTLPGHDETMANLDALTISPSPARLTPSNAHEGSNEN